MNLAELRAAVRAALERMERAHQAITDAAGNTDTTDEQRQQLESGFTTAETEHRSAVAALQRAEAVAEARANAPVQPEETPENRNGGSPNVTITNEPHTYRRDTNERSWLLDVARVRFGRGDSEGAQQRLDAHAREIRETIERREQAAQRNMSTELERMLEQLPEPIARALVNQGLVETRAMTRTDGAGGYFVPPAWLLDLYAGLPRAGRPFVEATTQIDLPAGTDSINIPRITTGSLTGIQTADNANVTAQDMVDNVVTAGVRTIAGQVDLAMQLLDQSPIAFDEIVFADLVADYFYRCEDQAINGSGSSGQVLGIRNTSGITTTAYTDASPTVPELYSKLAGSLSAARTARKLPITHGWLTPARQYWLTAALDSQSRPLVVPDYANPVNAAGVLSPADGQDVPVRVLGVTHRMTDAIPSNLGGSTNQDQIIHTRNSDHVWFEGTLRARALEEILSGSLGVRLQVFSYVAFTAGRFPAATSIVDGTGLTTPAF